MSATPTDFEEENKQLKSVISKMHIALLSCKTEKTPYGLTQHYDNKKIRDALEISEDIFLDNSSSKLLSAIETVRFSNNKSRENY